MSFVDLATLTLHRRTELEARLNIFNEKCDRAIDDIKRLKTKTQGFVPQLNCDPSELKERFLGCMKQLDEYMYLITDFNLSISKIDEASSIDYTPVHDMSTKALMPAPLAPFNLIDALSEPTPSTSTACPNNCPPEKPKRIKTPKTDQSLIVFSSTSSSEETMPQAKTEIAVKEVQCELGTELNKVTIEDAPILQPVEGNLPAQTVLESDQVYDATIMHVDGVYFWVITDDPDEVQNLMLEMTKFYSENHKPLSVKEVIALNCCAFFDDDSECVYRGLFLRMNEDDNSMAEIYAVDTGEMRNTPVDCVQPLYPRFCSNPPYARCCHLAGVDLVSYHKKSGLLKKQDAFMKAYAGTQCKIEVDDNTSESLGVYVVLPSGETLNQLFVQQGLALPIDKPVEDEPEPQDRQRVSIEDNYNINDCPEYEDPVEAVTGYLNRDEADICKHYKGGPEKTCFKGNRCNKKHILKHPDGWTLDRIPVAGKCKSVPLPAPGTWHKVLVTCVCHYDRVYVQLLIKKQQDELPNFGVILPATTLAALVRDMNSPATQIAYKRLTVTPAQGELVAALYPPDNSWYRARVLSVTRADQSVEVQYVDYGTILWVKEDQLRILEPRHLSLPAQGIRCVLAGVCARSRLSQQWAQAKQALTEMAQDKTLDAHVIARDYDEVSVELFDEGGYSIAEQLAAINMVDLVEFNVVDDSTVTQKIVVP